MSEAWVAGVADIDRLLQLLMSQDFAVIGPRLEGQTIGYGPIHSVNDLPVGWTEVQSAGRYRLRRREDRALFGFTLGAQGWRRFLQVPRESLFVSERDRRDKWQVQETEVRAGKRAFLGVRGCEWRGIQIQDRVFLEGKFPDPAYRVRRSDLLLIGVDCVTSAPTCFCTSMESGPEVGKGVDLALTEVVDATEHFFLVRSGTAQGERIIQSWQIPRAAAGQIDAAVRRLEENRKRVAKNPQIKTAHLQDDLIANWNHEHWDTLGAKCLACANCTLVCPTCFCSTTVEEVSLAGDRVERFRQWDSCFTAEHGYLHGGQVRPDVKSRYRQWLTHKLSTWQDQFQEIGCTGCGRCIVWCPVGIDLREEVQGLRESKGEL